MTPLIRTGPTETLTVSGCARCGGEHIDLALRPLPNTLDEGPQSWAMCPETEAPILVYIIETRS